MYPITSSPLWTGFRDLERLVDEVNHAFRRSPWPEASATPPINVWGDDQRVVISAEVPGADPASLNVNVLGDTLTISGTTDGVAFSRALQLPYRIDGERTEARSRDGVLTVTLHRPEADKPRSIAVSAA